MMLRHSISGLGLEPVVAPVTVDCSAYGAYNNPACRPPAGGGLTPSYLLYPTLPNTYNPATGAVSSSNTSGQTIASLPSNSADLCASQGGTWDGTNCNYNNLCSMPLGVYDSDTGTCDYTDLWLLAGGGLLLLALAFLGGRR
jgi:hypothetical protein